MQEEIEQKSFNIMISTTKLSARTVLRAVKAAFRLYQSKTSQGKHGLFPMRGFAFLLQKLLDCFL